MQKRGPEPFQRFLHGTVSWLMDEEETVKTVENEDLGGTSG